MAINNNTPNLTAKTFPGVYTSINDNSFLPPQVSRFSVGLIGVARKGPFDTPIAVGSLRDFSLNLGGPISGNFFLANAVAILAPLTDGMQVVRVGNQYTSVANVDFVGTVGFGSGVSLTGNGGIFSPSLSPTGQTFISITQQGLPSTVNAPVSTASSGTITLSGTSTLAATYTAANVAYSYYSDAAFAAEGVLFAYTYGTGTSNPVDVAIASAGTILSGTKNAFQFTVNSTNTGLSSGDLLKIKQPGQADTLEVRVQQVLPVNGGSMVNLVTTDLSDVGYQALSLQDNYGNGFGTGPAQIYRVNSSQKVPYLYLQASSAGDWANGSGPTTGVFVKVRPGSAQNTKKFEIYWNGALVETIDNLSCNPTSPNFYTTRINGFSQYITITAFNSLSGLQLASAANTSVGWNPAPQFPMPFPGINAGGSLTASGGFDPGGNLHNGFNGENAQPADFVGSYLPATDTFTGLQVFEDSSNIQVDFLCAPGVTDASTTIGVGTGSQLAVHQQMARIAKVINAVALIDVPFGFTARQAIDWHNGQGLWTGRGRLDTPNASIYWNWFTITDPFTGLVVTVPPTLGALRCEAFTFDAFKPWYAAAGDQRGLIPEAISLQFNRVSDDTKQAMYGHGQSVNGIFLDRGQIKLYGERTLQVAESKLSVVHNVVLVNTVVDNLASVGRRFVFEPNDPELLIRIKLAFSQYLDTVKNENGVEDYSLIIDSSNNTPDTRNLREVVVDLALIPVDTAERIYINATVNASGAVLNAATSDTTPLQ